MGYADPDLPKGDDSARRAEAGIPPSVPLPEAAMRSLDAVAAALNVTTALLASGLGAPRPAGTGPVALLEAATLLQSFIRIDDPAIRSRCLAFVKAEVGAVRA